MWAPANANTEINPAAHAGVCCRSQSSSTRRKTTSSRKGMAITVPIIIVVCAGRPRCILSSRPLSEGDTPDIEPTMAEAVALIRSVSGAHQVKCHRERVLF